MPRACRGSLLATLLFAMEGVVTAFTAYTGVKTRRTSWPKVNHCVLLKNSVSQMVYKHAISTVVPARNVRVPSADEAEAVVEPQAE